jgi:hypothetical protein
MKIGHGLIQEFRNSGIEEFRSSIYSKIENLVLPPVCKPYGLETGPGFFTLVI